MHLVKLNININYLFQFSLSFATVLLVVICVAFFTLLERKTLGGIQRRAGPNYVGFWGTLQAISDALKLLFKEITAPSGANFLLFMFSPIMILTLSLTVWAVIPFSSFNAISELNYSLFFIFIVSTLNVYNLILAGMSSNSRYALMGGVRSAAQMISYEIPMSLSLVGIGLVSGSFNLNNIIFLQTSFFNLILALPFFLIFFVCALAETNRTPFDLPEAEAELVAGYNVEYSSILFAFFFLAEYSNIMFMSFFITAVFFGAVKSYTFFYLKVILVMLTFIIIRGVLPRYKYSQLMDICWKYMFPTALGYLYFLAVTFYILKLSPSLGYDINISKLSEELINDGAFEKKICLEGDLNGFILIFFAAQNKNFNFLLHQFGVAAEYKKLFIFFLTALTFSLLLTVITWVLAPRNRSNAKNSSYECGYEPIGAPTARFEVHFYVTAILFIIFDVEILFLYPWVIGLARLPATALFTMTLFLVILLVGYAYEWLKGALNWEDVLLPAVKNEING